MKPRLSRRSFLLTVSALMIPTAAFAAQTRYDLEPSQSEVGFYFTMAGTNQFGTMPVRSADIRIDLQNLARSQVDVTVDVTGAKTMFGFARNAMLSTQVLNAAEHPDIRFVSTRIELGKGGRLSDGARVTGNLTLRGVTRPVTLQANLYRQAGSSPDDLDELSIQLLGQLSRSAFGADGFPELVTDIVSLDIKATIKRAN